MVFLFPGSDRDSLCPDRLGFAHFCALIDGAVSASPGSSPQVVAVPFGTPGTIVGAAVEGRIEVGTEGRRRKAKG